MKFDFITIGGLTEDIVFFSDEGLLIDNSHDLLRQKLLAFEQGAKINIKESELCFGGGASNTAVNLSNLGFRVACLSCLGSDERASKILKNLKNNKIDCSNIEVDKKKQSGFSFILNNRKDRIIFTYRGSNESLRVKPAHKDIIKKSSWVYLTSLPENHLGSLKNIFSAKNKIAWNPGLGQLADGAKKILPFIKRTDIFMVNKDEALEIVKNNKDFKGLSDEFLNNSKNLVALIKKLGPDKIILTDGVAGAYFFDGDNFHHQKIIKEQKRVDTTGVGDAFNSTVIGAMVKSSGDYKKAMLLGVKNTASLVTKTGAQNGLLKFTKI